MFQLLFLVVAIICSWCFNYFIPMLQLLLLVVAIYMFHGVSAASVKCCSSCFRVVASVLFQLSMLFGRGGASRDGRGRVVCRGLAGGGAGAGGRGGVGAMGSLGMQHARRGRGADATGYGAIWGRADSRNTEASGALRRHRGSSVCRC